MLNAILNLGISADRRFVRGKVGELGEVVEYSRAALGECRPPGGEANCRGVNECREVLDLHKSPGRFESAILKTCLVT